MTSSIEPTSNSLGSIILEQGSQTQEIDLEALSELENQPVSSRAQGVIESSTPPESISKTVVQEQSIQLLEERLNVDFIKRKIGEVVIRKQIETRIIEVPVRREKLIVEQINPEHKKILEIDLASETDLELKDYIPEGYQVSPDRAASEAVGEFDSPKTVAWLMDTIAHQSPHGCKRIRVAIELDDSTHSDLYQDWFDRCSIKKR
ncbi:MAG: DUF2382 domain-containing protein [Leptolyngbyaceae cyanobacterium CSU_1_3]|nr:DUF2382 domain-containing protein [Leptolyngbyaceae cyanobacterium CSU_1_3]